MKSGQYTMLFSCDGFAGTGRLELDGSEAKGGDGRFRVTGQITQTGKTLLGALTIEMRHGLATNVRIGGVFACAMTGSSNDDSFSLYGIGPLGLIIEINGQWAGEIANRSTDRRQSA